MPVLYHNSRDGAWASKAIYQASASDPLTFAVTALILIAAAPGFLYPAPRANRVDPMIARRYE